MSLAWLFLRRQRARRLRDNLAKVDQPRAWPTPPTMQPRFFPPSGTKVLINGKVLSNATSVRIVATGLHVDAYYIPQDEAQRLVLAAIQKKQGVDVEVQLPEGIGRLLISGPVIGEVKIICDEAASLRFDVEGIVETSDALPQTLEEQVQVLTEAMGCGPQADKRG